MKSANFVVSLDCELLWGSHYVGGEKKFKYLENGLFKYYCDLIDLFDEYKISATFAFVGAIAISMEEFRDRVTGFAINSKYNTWLENILVMLKNTKSISSWHDRRILECVLSSKQKHEIASHSFTHLRFDNIDDQKVAVFELATANEILSKCCGEQIKTFIFPENRIRHLEEFKLSSYAIYRGRDDTWYGALPFERLFHFIDQVLPFSPRPVELKTDEYNNYYVSGSMLLFAYDGVRKFIPDWLRYIKIKRGIDRAVIEKKVFHIWFHPWNLGSSPRMIKLLERVLAYVDKCRNKGLLTVSTIGDLLFINHKEAA